jgi:hypothetical protein
MNEIDIFGSFVGLVLNRNKAEGIWIGKLKNCKLGETNRRNEKSIYSMGKINIKRKILIIKTRILPKFTFLASSCAVPKMYII